MPRYAPIRDFPGCRVGTDGSVWTRWVPYAREPIFGPWRRCATYLDSGYTGVYLRRGKERVCRMVHLLVLETFRGTCPTDMEARHIDGDRANPRLRNLKWGTPVANWADRKRHGRARGKRLTKQERGRLYFRRNHLKEKISDLAVEYGIDRVTASRICRK